MTAADASLENLVVVPNMLGGSYVKNEERKPRFKEDVMVCVQTRSIWVTCGDCRGDTSTYQPLSDHRHR